MLSAATTNDSIPDEAPAPSARQTLLVSAFTHALHDGFTDSIYVLLPVWQAELGLGYAALAILRSLYTGSMALFQVPAGRIGARVGPRAGLALGTAATAIGYLAAGLSGGLLALCGALAFAGAGSAVQHPVASSAVARAYGRKSRAALGTYNFSGDLGKAAIPAALSLLIVHASWHKALLFLGAAGLCAAGLIALFMPARANASPVAEPIDQSSSSGQGAGGFPLLMGIGILDTSVRMGLLTFLPFLLKAKGADLPMVGVALALVFIGGAAGKFACGWLGEHVGLLWTVVITEGGTAAFIFALLLLPLHPTLFLLPLLGVMLNGTSSVLYGTVPELAPAHRAEHAFAVFYTAVIGAGAVSPVLFGVLGDAVSARWATAATALTALATIPFAMALAPRLRR